MSDQFIAWGDVETTGINPNTNALLEVAFLVTDLDLNILDEKGYHAIIKHDQAAVYDLADDYVKNMHTATGLWEKLATGQELFSVNASLVQYLQDFAPEPRTIRLAGNSVRLDANYIDAYLPDVSAHLHYRILDVSTLAFEAYHVRGVPVMRKKHSHVAMEDVRESIEELRYLRKELYR